MARVDVISKLMAKHKSSLDFNYDALMAPPMTSILSPTDIGDLYEIATSLKLSSKIVKKYNMIDQIMERRGFREFHAGTNRRIYQFPDISYLMAKVAIDEAGMPDNRREYDNSFLIKPRCTKVFEYSACSTVGFFERVEPILSRAEFVSIGDSIYDLINDVIGEYVLSDIGTNTFMNYGIRKGFGPVLLDFPYLYKLDGNKLYCNNFLLDGTICNGVIDYDAGFNNLVCKKCGKVYQASELETNIKENKINIERGINYMSENKMRVFVGNKKIYDSNDEIVETKKIVKQKPIIKENNKSDSFKIKVTVGGVEIIDGTKSPTTSINDVLAEGIKEVIEETRKVDFMEELQKVNKELEEQSEQEVEKVPVSETDIIEKLDLSKLIKKEEQKPNNLDKIPGGEVATYRNNTTILLDNDNTTIESTEYDNIIYDDIENKYKDYEEQFDKEDNRNIKKGKYKKGKRNDYNEY